MWCEHCNRLQSASGVRYVVEQLKNSWFDRICGESQKVQDCNDWNVSAAIACTTWACAYRLTLPNSLLSWHAQAYLLTMRNFGNAYVPMNPHQTFILISLIGITCMQLDDKSLLPTLSLWNTAVPMSSGKMCQQLLNIILQAQHVWASNRSLDARSISNSSNS